MTSSSRAKPSSSAPAGACRATGATHPSGRHRGRAARRVAPRVGRRAGLVGPRAGPRPRAARPVDRRPVVVHPGRLQRPDPRRPRAAPALPRAEPARRALGELRDHRGRRRFRRPDAAGDRGPRSGDRRLPAQRREVVRDRSRRHGLHDLPLPRRGRRGAAPDALPGRLRHARASPCSTIPTTPTPSPTGTRSSC